MNYTPIKIILYNAQFYCCHLSAFVNTTGCFYLSFIPSAQQSLWFGRRSVNAEHIPVPTVKLGGRYSLGMHLNTVSFPSLEAQGTQSEVRWVLIQFNLCRDVRVYCPHPLDLEKCHPPPLCQAIQDHPSHWAQASGFHRTALWVSLPGQGQPEFSRSRTILGNICTRGTTNTFVFFQHSLLCLSQTPPFLQQKSQPWEECSIGLWEDFSPSKWGLALGICEIISKEIISEANKQSLKKSNENRTRHSWRCLR